MTCDYFITVSFSEVDSWSSLAFSCADIIKLDSTLLSLHILQVLRELNAIISKQSDMPVELLLGRLTH